MSTWSTIGWFIFVFLVGSSAGRAYEVFRWISAANDRRPIKVRKKQYLVSEWDPNPHAPTI